MPLAGGALVGVLLFLLLETIVRMLGNEPGVRDGAVLWGMERTRADNPGAIVLIGGSRMLLDVDVARLSALSARPVVQLAVDGQSFQAVLRDLADDENFHGTVLVDVLDQNLSTDANVQRSQEWVDHWRKHGLGQWSAYSDGWLALRLQSVSGWYAAEPPWPEMFRRIAAGVPTSGYLVTLPDRGRRADYGPLEMQANAYASRVLRNFGRPVDLDGVRTIGEFEARINGLLDQEHALDVPGFAEQTRLAREQVARIQARGGRVVFVRMPSRGLVRRIEDVRYPRAMFWDRFVAGTGAGALYFADDPKLATYLPPDGSHLDRRDVQRYTEDLYAALTARKLL